MYSLVLLKDNNTITNSTTTNNIQRTKEWWASGFMNINPAISVRWNWFAEIKTEMVIDERQPMSLRSVCS